MLHPRKDYQHIQDPKGKIPEDEPVFLLRGQDKIAPMLVRVWAAMNWELGGDRRLTDAAYEHANEMDAWPVKKIADLPADYDQPVIEPEQPAAEPGPAAEPEQQDDKTKSDAAARRKAGNSPW